MIFVFLLAASRAFCSEVTALCSLFLLYHRFTLYAVDTRGRHSELSTVTLRTACPLVDDNKAEGRWPSPSPPHFLHFQGPSHILVSKFCTHQSPYTTPFLPPHTHTYWHREKNAKGLEEEHGAKWIKAMKEIEIGWQYLCQCTDLLLFYRICVLALRKGMVESQNHMTVFCPLA